jgi:protocatechuate 4,5-dioxygenase alpha chain
MKTTTDAANRLQVNGPSGDPRDAWNLPGTYVFDLALSRRGYAFNRMCARLRLPAERDAFVADPDGYMRAHGVGAAHRDAVHRRDWLELTRLGGNLFFFLKLAAALGIGLYTIGAQMRGQSYEDFMRTRRVPGAV